MRRSCPEVFKFGGVAVGNAEAIRIALGHVRKAAPNVAVVVSAMNGITDLLLEAGQSAFRRDVARKALILARTLGFRAEPDEIRLEPLFHDDGSHADARAFIDSLGVLDDTYRERIERARRGGKVLRYVAKIRSRAISVGIEAVPPASPLAHLRGTDNQVAIYSKRYKTNPLVVTGPGAGAIVTAAGVLNDIVAIAMEERRRRTR
jgi:hypothetical protein